MLKMLIAVDGSDLSNRAIEAVGAMARSGLDVEACLICVSPNIFLEPAFSADYGYVAMQKVEEEQKRQQDLTLSKATDLARAQGLKLTEPERGNGVIANEIVRVATERKVNQIAMGTRGMGALGSVFMGSVAQRVIHQSPVPVLLAK
jgi:nucleotide-binding universal stress UspA family protein